MVDVVDEKKGQATLMACACYALDSIRINRTPARCQAIFGLTVSGVKVPRHRIEIERFNVPPTSTSRNIPSITALKWSYSPQQPDILTKVAHGLVPRSVRVGAKNVEKLGTIRFVIRCRVSRV